MIKKRAVAICPTPSVNPLQGSVVPTKSEDEEAQTEKEPTTVGVIRLRTWVGVMFNGKDDRSNIKGKKGNKGQAAHTTHNGICCGIPPLLPPSPSPLQIQSTDTHEYCVKIIIINRQQEARQAPLNDTHTRSTNHPPILLLCRTPSSNSAGIPAIIRFFCCRRQVLAIQN